jgi:F0F1-type ATP synthase assembly protein I
VARPEKSWLGQAGVYLGLAFLLPSATFVGYLIGYLLDKAFGTHFLYIPFLLLGIAGGLVELIRELPRDWRDGGS